MTPLYALHPRDGKTKWGEYELGSGPKQCICMMYDSEASGCGLTSCGGGESLDGVSAKRSFTNALTALKSAEENDGWSANHQGATVVVRLERLPIFSLCGCHVLIHTDRNSRS